MANQGETKSGDWLFWQDEEVGQMQFQEEKSLLCDSL
jgi:hypothetical protein